MFQKYHIFKEDYCYKIATNTGFENKLFSSLKHAVVWCIFDNRNKLYQTKRIEHLDKMIAGAEVNILVHKNLIGKTRDIENKLIYVSKMCQEQAKKRFMIQEMDKFIEDSKNWQSKKFATK